MSRRSPPPATPTDIPTPAGHTVHYATIGKRGEHSMQFPSRGLDQAMLWDPIDRVWVKASAAGKGWKHYRAIALPIAATSRS